MLVSCANYGRMNPAGGIVPSTFRSHDLRGVNGAFYDGSARWVSYEEVVSDGIATPGSSSWYLGNLVWPTPEAVLNTDIWPDNFSNFNVWARRYSRVSRE